MKYFRSSCSVCSNCIGEEAKAAAANLKAGEVLLLENLRFIQKKREMLLCKELAGLEIFM
jgi:phosphoglycerate kinase